MLTSLLMVEEGYVDAIEYGQGALGRSLRAAREAAGLSQRALAGRIGQPASWISRAETGKVRVKAAQIAGVLRGCGLPENWTLARKHDIGAK